MVQGFLNFGDVSDLHNLTPDTNFLIPDDYEPTRISLAVKPNKEEELDDAVHVKKSLTKYGIMLLIPIVFMVMAMNGIYQPYVGDNTILYVFVVVCLGVLTAIIYDYLNNKNEFTISKNGIFVHEELLPWQSILATALKRVPTKPKEVFLVIFINQRPEMEIKLNGLAGSPAAIGNTIELFKRQYFNSINDIDALPLRNK